MSQLFKGLFEFGGFRLDATGRMLCGAHVMRGACYGVVISFAARGTCFAASAGQAESSESSRSASSDSSLTFTTASADSSCPGLTRTIIANGESFA